MSNVSETQKPQTEHSPQTVVSTPLLIERCTSGLRRGIRLTFQWLGRDNNHKWIFSGVGTRIVVLILGLVATILWWTYSHIASPDKAADRTLPVVSIQNQSGGTSIGVVEKGASINIHESVIVQESEKDAPIDEINLPLPTRVYEPFRKPSIEELRDSSLN